MKRDSLEDFQRAVNKLAEHAEAMRSGCIIAYCWVEWHTGLSAARRSETAFISVVLERVRLMSQEWRNYECIIRESRGGETVAQGHFMWPHSWRTSAPWDQEQEKRRVLETSSLIQSNASSLTWLAFYVLQVISWGIIVYWTFCGRRAMRWSTHHHKSPSYSESTNINTWKIRTNQLVPFQSMSVLTTGLEFEWKWLMLCTRQHTIHLLYTWYNQLSTVWII